MTFRCACCDQPTLEGPPGTNDEICPVCGWQDDHVDNQDTDVLGPNHVTLSVARENFRKFGNSDPNRPSL